MTKTKSTGNKNKLLIISLIGNGLFILTILAYVASSAILASADLNFAKYNALTSEMCGEKYDYYIQQSGDARGEEGKKAYASTVCLRDYKTGKQLDLEPLLTP